MELILIRHAEPIKLIEVDGPADPPLSDRGQRQAELLAGFVTAQKIDAIFSSPQLRARQTAAAVADAVGLPVVVDDSLAEFDRTSPTYIPIEEMRATKDAKFMAMLDDDFGLYGIDMNEFKRQVVTGVEAIIEAHPSKRVLAFCHGGVINAYIGHILGVPRNMFFSPDYTSVNRVGASRSGTRSVLRLNEVTHLHGHALLTSTV